MPTPGLVSNETRELKCPTCKTDVQAMQYRDAWNITAWVILPHLGGTCRRSLTVVYFAKKGVSP